VTASYLFALGVVALIMGGAFILVRLAQARGLSLARVSPIKVIGQQSLGVGASLVLVDVDGARVLVGVSKAGVHGVAMPVQDTRPAVLLANDDTPPTSFSAVLKRAGSWR
jgi:flagellar biogenesis protein FliO